MSDNSKFRDILLQDRYLLPDENCWEDVCSRVAKFLAESVEEEEEFFDIMNDQVALPGSPTLMNAGTKYPMLSSCFILPIEDNLDSIMQTVKDAAIVTARGGGIGFDFSKIRPQGSVVSSTNGAALGPIGVIRILDGVINEIKQSGRRRGALMGVLSINHPDVVKFIECKKIDGAITNFNLSVMVDDAFIAKLRAGDASANKVWDQVITNAHANGEPGIMFYDNINRVSPYLKHGIEITASNPCGELSAPDWASCNLGSINVARLIKMNDSLLYEFDEEEFRAVIQTMVKLLNRVIDKNLLPLPGLIEFIQKWRPIGLGVMGLHDLLIKLGIVYGSDDSFKLANRIGQILLEETNSLQKLYGNTTMRTIAPTGSISILAECSSSIEPIFDYKMKRLYTDNTGTQFEFNLVHPIYADHEEFGKRRKELFIRSTEISPENHLRMQAVFQTYIDTAISKTILLPHDISLEDTKGIYLRAHELGCKGVTIYRDMSRANQVYQSTKAVETHEPRMARTDNPPAPTNRKDRPRALPGYTYKCRVSGGSFYVTINYHDGRAFEVFATPSVDDGSPELIASTEALTRNISLGLRHGISKDDIAKQLKRVRGQSLLSMPGQLGRILEEFQVPEAAGEAPVVPRRYCPSCEKELTFDGSCWHCESCGWAKCE